eukprot:UN2265
MPTPPHSSRNADGHPDLGKVVRDRGHPAILQRLYCEGLPDPDRPAAIREYPCDRVTRDLVCVQLGLTAVPADPVRHLPHAEVDVRPRTPSQRRREVHKLRIRRLHDHGVAIGVQPAPQQVLGRNSHVVEKLLLRVLCRGAVPGVRRVVLVLLWLRQGTEGRFHQSVATFE